MEFKWKIIYRYPKMPYHQKISTNSLPIPNKRKLIGNKKKLDSIYYYAITIQF